MKNCSSCEKLFEPVAWQVKKGEWICGNCRRARQKAWRENRKALGMPVVSTRMPTSYHQAYEAKYYARSDVKSRRAMNAQIRRADPSQAERISARSAVYNAVRRKDISKMPCEVCGIEKAEAHHEDYSKPLEVRWLCRRHHRQHHAKATGALT